MSSKSEVQMGQLAEKIALELVFASPGKDEGLLPINSLLGQIEEVCASDPSGGPIQQAIALARRWVDSALEIGSLSAGAIERLSAWTRWTQAALSASQAGQSPPPVPEALSAAEEANAAADQRPAAAAQASEEEPVRLNLESNGSLLREFADESREHLQNIELAVLKLEEQPEDADTLNSVFRAFHTLKGGSGFLNLVPVNRLAHELESLLDLARQGKLAIDSGVIDLILSGRDVLQQFIAGIELQLAGQQPPGPIHVPIQTLLGQIRAVAQGPVPGHPPAALVPLPSGGSTSEAQTKGAGEDSERRFEAPSQKAKAMAPGPGDGPGRDGMGETGVLVGNNGAKPAASSVKVDTTKLDNLVDLVGEMVIAQSQVAQDPELCALHSPQLTRNIAQLNRITNDLHKAAMSLRMVPIRPTFQKMTRLVRDLSAKAGKLVELRLSGEDTELDRNIIEAISDPLVHMIRNAVDHGIEKSEQRLARGKPERGTILLRAFHEGGNIVIEIQDDGAGLSQERILAKGIERGLINPNEPLGEKDIFELIFAPGFSTAEKVTEISGRGVGMDVVRRNIDKLHGKIEVKSVAGQGSTFSIYLPLTLAIIDGLLVSVGSERFILPTLSVRESFRPTAEMLATVRGRGKMVNVRGKLSPLVRLYRHFDLQPSSTDPTQSIVVVVDSNHEQRCLLVDKLLGKQEVVIKSLGETFKQNRMLAGAAILGDGRVGLILDVNTLGARRTATDKLL